MENVECEYFFELEHKNQDGQYDHQERRPHNDKTIFEPGDFKEYHEKSLDVLHFMIKGVVNPKSFAIAFEKLIQEFPGINRESIIRVTKRRDGVTIDIQVPPDTNKGEAERILDDTYTKSLPSASESSGNQVSIYYTVKGDIVMDKM